MVISLTGFMGSGKSRVGRELAESLGWEFTDLDRYIEHKMDQSIPEIFKDSEMRFRAIEAEAVRDILTMKQITGENLVLALGGGTLTIKPIVPLVLEHSECVYLRTGLDAIISRLGTSSKSRPLFHDKYNIERLLDERIPIYELAPHTIDTDGKDPVSIVAEIKEKISYLCAICPKSANGY